MLIANSANVFVMKDMAVTQQLYAKLSTHVTELNVEPTLSVNSENVTV